MKHLITAALALALVSGTSALAQPGEPDRHPEQGGHAGGQPAPRAAPAPQAAPRGPQGGARPGGGYQGQGAARPGGGYQGAPASQGAAHGGYQGGSGAAHMGPGAAQSRQGGAAHAVRGVPSTYNPRFGAPGFRPGGSARPQYSAQYFPRVFSPGRQYAWRGGVWSGQPGYYYRRWSYGDRLPYGWFAAQWFINDYYYYDLPVPPYGYAWVRVGPDALLVDIDDGMVVESVYGLFS